MKLRFIQLLKKPYENEVTLTEQNILKMLQPVELLLHFGKGVRSFHTGNIGSEGQSPKDCKLITVKL